MTVRIAQFVHATSDVVDEAFLREFPEIEVVKADSLETLADEPARARQHAPLSFGCAAQTRGQNTRRNAPGF